MATKNYADLQREIKALTEQAEKVRNAEKAGVVQRMKEAIEAYEISVKDLFGTRASTTKTPRGKSAGRGASGARSATGRAVAYSDGNGGVWGGRGPRPMWLRNAIASGRQLDEFAVGANGTSGTNGAAGGSASASASGDVQVKGPSKKRAAKGKQGLPAKFKDAAGNSWSGRGSQPSWLKAALASGKSLDDLRA